MPKFLLLVILLLPQVFVCSAQTPPYLTAKLAGRTGNMCFQIATASALAWDHGAEAHFPELSYHPADFEGIFFRCSTTPPRRIITGIVQEMYPLPFKSGIRLQGYFQSEKYFAHHRQKILQLFAPKQQDAAYIKAHYSWILNHPHVVGVQLRYYGTEVSDGYPQYGIQYLEKAMAYFPPETLFVVSSDNVTFAKANIPAWAENVYFLENESPYIQLFILSLCKDNIISNSTFGWWAAWLNQNPNKIVLRPSFWTVASLDYIFPVCPEEWISIDAKPEQFP